MNRGTNMTANGGRTGHEHGTKQGPKGGGQRGQFLGIF